MQKKKICEMWVIALGAIPRVGIAPDLNSMITQYSIQCFVRKIGNFWKHPTGIYEIF